MVARHQGLSQVVASVVSKADRGTDGGGEVGIIDVPKKVEIARRNWYETDCNGLSVAVIKEAYERGFNRAYHLAKEPEPVSVIRRTPKVQGFRNGNCPKCGALLNQFHNTNNCGQCGQKVKWE